MLRSVFRNVAISAAAFFAVSVVGLLLVPVLIGNYGIAGFGTIVLARLFFPTAALGVLDFGFGETATQAVARARADGDWSRGSRMLRQAALATAVVGATAAALLLLTAPWLPSWLGLASGDHEAFTTLLRVTALILPLQFFSLVAEGVVKGFERFGAMRSLEVLAALSYAAGVLLIVAAGGSAIAAGYALVAALTLRAVVGSVMALLCLKPHWSRPLGTVAEERAWFLAITRGMAVNKLLGTSQTQLAPLLIGLLLGPSGAGIYEALSRLPRAIKAVLGLLSSTVLPVASRLETESDASGMRRLGQAGVLVVGIVALPPVVASMVFSEPLLRLWIGTALSPLWAWQSLMFVIPGLSVLLSFGGTVLLVRPRVVAAMNRLTAIQVALQFLVALAAISWLSERAFIFGQVVAVATTFLPLMRLVGTELDIDKVVYQRLLRLVGALAVLAGSTWWIGRHIETWIQLGSAMTLWTLLGWSTGLLFGFSLRQRSRLMFEVQNLMKRKLGRR